jgi:hypothetical protein
MPKEGYDPASFDMHAMVGPVARREEVSTRTLQFTLLKGSNAIPTFAADTTLRNLSHQRLEQISSSPSWRRSRQGNATR